MKILFVAMSESIHTARWINQISNEGWDIHLFPSDSIGFAHPHLQDVKIHYPFYIVHRKTNNNFYVRKLNGFLSRFYFLAKLRLIWHRISSLVFIRYRVFYLSILILILKPDIIHSLEFQHSSYLTLHTKKRLKKLSPNFKFPDWIVTNWGSDIYLFGRLAEHQEMIQKLLAECDYYSCECERDIELAKALGLRGQVLPVIPNGGGFKTDTLEVLSTVEPPSRRKVIVLKGYQHWAGRALYGVRAIELCAEHLRGYQIVIYSTAYDVQIAAKLVAQANDLDIECLSVNQPLSHEAMLQLFGRARVYMGLSISDAISTSMIEAMAMGTFPIQSYTACTNEWFVDGESGLAVPPEDPQVIAESLRRALTDDTLVDRAAELNKTTIRERLDYEVIRAKVLDLYKNIFNHKVKNYD